MQGQGHSELPSAGDTGEPGGLGIPGEPGVLLDGPSFSSGSDSSATAMM